MQKNPTVLCIAISFFTAAGCVSKSKYETLKKTQEDTAQTLAARDKKITLLEQALEQERARSAKLDKRIASVQTALEDQVRQLQDQLTSVVKDRARLEASAQELQRALADLQMRKLQAEGRVAQYRSLLSKFKSLIDAGKLRVKIAQGRMVLELPTDVLFPSGSAKLSEAGAAAVVEISSVLATIESREFQIEGHTDDVPIKTRRFPTNWELAAERALNVAKKMVDAGMDPTHLSAASFGEYRPVAANDSDENKARNRRIEIVIVPDLSKLPGFEELTQAVGS